jgi:hypothetical protein
VAAVASMYTTVAAVAVGTRMAAAVSYVGAGRQGGHWWW